MQAWVSCSMGRTTACDLHALGCDQCGEERSPDLKHSAFVGRRLRVQAKLLRNTSPELTAQKCLADNFKGWSSTATHSKTLFNSLLEVSGACNTRDLKGVLICALLCPCTCRQLGLQRELVINVLRHTARNSLHLTPRKEAGPLRRCFGRLVADSEDLRHCETMTSVVAGVDIFDMSSPTWTRREGGVFALDRGTEPVASEADRWALLCDPVSPVLEDATKYGQKLKGARLRQGVEVDEVIPGMQPSSNETDGGFIVCEVEERQAARVEVQGLKRRVIRVESEETQDSVRERIAHEENSQEEADVIGFVPSALREPRGVYCWRDNRCGDKALRYMQIASVVIEEGGEARTINLCQRCYNEKLVQQGKQSLKSKEWREIVERKAVSARNVGVFQSQKGHGQG